MSAPQHRPPLRGVRVIDLTRLLPGPMCTLHLADLGADVIKVEDLKAGDYAAPIVRELLNRNKRGIQIDLKHPSGVATLLRLCESADVLVEGFRPGVMARLGVGYDVVKQHNPKLVYCSISGYGQTGPLSQLGGHDVNYAALAGVSHQVGTPQGDLALSNVPVADLLGGTMNAVMGILAALFDAARTGVGRHVDVAMADGVLAHAVLPLAALHTHGQVRATGADKLTGALPCYGFYATQDGRYLAVGALEAKFWQRFCECLQRLDLAPLHLSATPAQQQWVRDELSALIKSQPLSHWVAVFQGEDCCVTPVLTLDESLQQAHFVQRGMVHPGLSHSGQPMTQLACPVQMSDFVFQIERSAPAQGQHTTPILQELGFTDDAIASLFDQEAVA